MIVARGWKLPEVAAYVGKPLLFLFAWDVLIAVLYVLGGQKWLAVDEIPMSLLGSALAIFVTARNNSAYGRWWEARKLWGGVVNWSRTLARQTKLYLDGHPAAEPLVRLGVAYVHALRCHLRKQSPWEAIGGFIDRETESRLEGLANVPDGILAEIAARLAVLHREGTLDTIQMAAFDGALAELCNMQGGAERIKNTPLPRQYTLFPPVFIQLFCLLLPLAMVHDLGIATPLGSTMVGFLLMALDRIGSHLEDPFENTVHDVPLTSITRTIEINLLQALGLRETRPPVQAENGVMW